jgi:hypothetical protein
MKIANAIMGFGQFLNASWNSVEYLQVYGDGADLNGSSSRITDFKSIATHRIVVKSRVSENLFDILNNVNLEENGAYEFDKFVGFENGFYNMIPIFSHLLVYDNSSNIERVFKISDVDFELQKM